MKKNYIFTLILPLLLLTLGACSAGEETEPAQSAAPVVIQTSAPTPAPSSEPTEDPVNYEAILEIEGGDGQGEAGVHVESDLGSGAGLEVNISAEVAAQFAQWKEITLNGDADSDLPLLTLSDALSTAGGWTVVTASGGLADEMTGVSLTITAMSGGTLTIWAETDLVRYADCDHPVFYRTGSTLYYRVLPWAEAERAAREAR